MNKGNRNRFDRMFGTVHNYSETVGAILNAYQQTVKDIDRVYKEDTASAEKEKARAAAREKVLSAKADLAKAIGAETAELRAEFLEHLSARPSAGFLDSLRLFREFQIQPSRTELESLLSANGGNALGLRALNSFLSSVGSKFRIEAPAAEDFEKDLKTLERIAQGAFFYIPLACHTAGCEIFKGTDKPLYKSDGTEYHNGTRWGAVDILSATQAFTSNMKDLEQAADRWSNSVMPSIKTLREVYKVGEKDGATDEALSDIRDTADSATISDGNNAEMYAVERAKQNAKEAAQYSSVMDHYLPRRPAGEA